MDICLWNRTTCTKGCSRSLIKKLINILFLRYKGHNENCTRASSFTDTIILTIQHWTKSLTKNSFERKKNLHLQPIHLAELLWLRFCLTLQILYKNILTKLCFYSKRKTNFLPTFWHKHLYWVLTRLIISE